MEMSMVPVVTISQLSFFFGEKKEVKAASDRGRLIWVHFLLFALVDCNLLLSLLVSLFVEDDPKLTNPKNQFTFSFYCVLWRWERELGVFFVLSIMKFPFSNSQTLVLCPYYLQKFFILFLEASRKVYNHHPQAMVLISSTIFNWKIPSNYYQLEYSSSKWPPLLWV